MPVRSTLKLFTLGMEFKLRQNDSKGGWEDMTPLEIVSRIEDELAELKEAVEKMLKEPNKQFRVEHVCWETFDIANFCYFLWHNISRPYRVTAGLD